MRTTVNLDDDVLLAVKELARQRKMPIGKVLSELARRALTREIVTETRNGIPLFPVQQGAGIVTLELVNQLRDGHD